MSEVMLDDLVRIDRRTPAWGENVWCFC